MTSRKRIGQGYRPVSRLLITGALPLLFAFLIWSAGRSGLGSFRTSRAVKANSVADAEAAIVLTPADADAHAVRGALFEVSGDLPSAIREYRTAASLRPEDYVLWLALARASELNGDKISALAAAKRALPLAPFYAQPHWQLGNLLIRVGQREEGFHELRLAAASNPAMLPGIIDLAWQLSAGDPGGVIQTIQPETPETFLALATYFKKRGAIADAIAMLRSAGSAGEQERRQYLLDLISSREFIRAYALWSVGHPGNVSGSLVDPGFEQEQSLDEPGFGWRTDYKAPSITLSLDPANPKEGHSSLRVDFNGESDPGKSIISQLVLIEPKAHYQLLFECRADALVTGGPPNVLILDASDNRVLGQSGPLPQTAATWLERTIDFVGGDTSAAVKIVLQRNRCTNSACPVFGRLWLDAFSLQKK